MVEAAVISSIATTFMFLTIPVYFLYLIMLYRHRKDESLKFPFFKLIFSIGIADLCQILNLLFGNTLAGWGIVPQLYIFLGGMAARLSNMGLFGFVLAQNLGMLFVAINRFTAIITPIQHLKIWSDRLTRNLIIIQWIIPLIVITPLIYPFQFQIALQADNRTVLLQWVDSTHATYYNVFCSVVISGPIALTIITIYPTIFITAIVRKVRSKQPMGKAEKAALKMACIGFIISIGLIIYLGDLYQRLISWNIYRTFWTDVPTFWMIYNIGNTIYASSNPYAMFIFSSAVRDRFIRMIFGSWLLEHGAVGSSTKRASVRTITVNPTMTNKIMYK